MPIVLTNDNYDSIVNGNTVLIVFSANWCGPCKRMKPEFLAVEEIVDSKKLIFAIVDVDVSSDIAIKYNVSNLPTLVLINNRDIVASHKGTMTRTKILELINNNINDC